MAHASIRITHAWLLGLLLQFGMSCAQAEAISKRDAQAVQATVQRQFDAFEKDDAAAAFALASGAIRSQFGDAEKFMAVVRQRYLPVYRHRSAFFTGAQRNGDIVIQSVRLTDADDRVWVALYHVQRESDGQWRILGCELRETTSVST